ncbi:hypothetical protein K437DRAFT_225117 [Tilletiaria anomala UBC 951]|uniref:Ubiquinol-cytochrome c chaperone domain-containing protein n=1 Tax=Tilletiaria anomala (strain ATCC 24038 / CBS 436.72 / UBC 951) TaxID=1037660 RepID=A0A066VV10_TILAU|nr:uncharacterized protein K437DRAFT_225117 [Tilletiaria anomala UBC 951]KDN44133.1 hypothetical protein K437DRAFT_225117 [Tilletiaria anomala UBC 951]
MCPQAPAASCSSSLSQSPASFCSLSTSPGLRLSATPCSSQQKPQRSASTSALAQAPAAASKPGHTPRLSISAAQQQQNQIKRGPFSAATLSPSAPPPSEKGYSRLTVAVVRALAKLMGYNRMGSSAIRVTSDLYDRCAEVAELQKDFWYHDAGLPATYQTWFHITYLHVWLLHVRFRSLASPPCPPGAAQAYAQELINHFFIDAESRMRQRFGVQTARLVKGYMKDMHTQQRGALVGLDQSLAAAALHDDTQLAAALWRNIWGAGGFGGHVGGVKRKIKGIDRTEKGQDPSEEGTPELQLDTRVFGADGKAGASPSSHHNLAGADSFAKQHPELAFPQHLERLTLYVRREVQRLAMISDADILAGRAATDDKDVMPGSIFGRV